MSKLRDYVSWVLGDIISESFYLSFHLGIGCNDVGNDWNTLQTSLSQQFRVDVVSCKAILFLQNLPDKIR